MAWTNITTTMNMKDKLGKRTTAARKLRGLEKLCKLYGRIKVGSVVWQWDYANEIAVPESDMIGKRLKLSEKARWLR